MDSTVIIYALVTVILALAGCVTKFAYAYDKLRKENTKFREQCIAELAHHQKELNDVQEDRIKDLKEIRRVVESPREMVALIVEAINKTTGKR